LGGLGPRIVREGGKIEPDRDPLRTSMDAAGRATKEAE